MTMTWKNIETYISVPSAGFLHELYKNREYPWSPLAHLRPAIEQFVAGFSNQGQITADKAIFRNKNNSLKEGSYHILKTEILREDFVDLELCIFISSGTMIEAGAIIKNHTIIEKNCEIRQGAYLRGFCYIGENSVVGHTTEIKNSIFTKHVEAGHFAYIGDSIIGSFVNLGAGTKISNLEFRSLNAKMEDHFPEISFKVEKQNIKTGLSKFGAIIGDGSETGCNSVLCPFVLLEPKCWIMPNFCVTKGVYKKGTIFRYPSIKKTIDGKNFS